MVSNSLNRIDGQDAAEEYVRAIKESSVTAFAGQSSDNVCLFELTCHFRSPAASETVSAV